MSTFEWIVVTELAFIGVGIWVYVSSDLTVTALVHWSGKIVETLESMNRNLYSISSAVEELHSQNQPPSTRS